MVKGCVGSTLTICVHVGQSGNNTLSFLFFNYLPWYTFICACNRAPVRSFWLHSRSHYVCPIYRCPTYTCPTYICLIHICRITHMSHTSYVPSTNVPSTYSPSTYVPSSYVPYAVKIIICPISI